MTEKKAPKKKKGEPEKRRTIQRSLRVDLTEKETLIFSRDLAKVNQDLANEENIKKEVIAEFASKMSMLKSNIFNLSQKISNGYEHRSVDVDVYFDYKKGLKIFIRRDTKKVVAEEAMTDHDRQQEFPLKDKKDKEAEKKKIAEEKAKAEKKEKKEGKEKKDEKDKK